MDKSFKDMMYLIRCVINGEKVEFTSEMECNEIYRHALLHQVVPIILTQFDIAFKLGLFNVSEETYKKLKFRHLSIITRDMSKVERFQLVLKAANDNNIKCILLKGELLADLYPSPELRISGDVDLYVSIHDEKRFLSILKKMGYIVRPRLQTEYHSVCVSDDMKNIEVHVSLYEDFCSDIWFKDIQYDLSNTQKYMTKSGIECYTLSIDDQLLFNVLHMVKHFMSGGIGIRQILDIALFMRKYGCVINKNEFFSVVKRLRYEYLINCCLLISIKYLGFKKEELLWIDGVDVTDDLLNQLLRDIEEGGAFGSNGDSARNLVDEYTKSVLLTLNKGSSKGYVKKRKQKVWFSLLFPDIERMKKKYKFLKNYPMLLPFVWVHRIINYLLRVKTYNVNEKEIVNSRLKLLKELRII